MRRSSSSDQDSSDCLRARDLFLGMVPPVPPAGQLPSKQGEDSQKKKQARRKPIQHRQHRSTPVHTRVLPRRGTRCSWGSQCNASRQLLRFFSFDFYATYFGLPFALSFCTTVEGGRDGRRQRDEERAAAEGGDWRRGPVRASKMDGRAARSPSREMKGRRPSTDPAKN